MCKDVLWSTNIGDTFQRGMGIAFIDIDNAFIVLYLEDLTIFSKRDEDHTHHLRKLFERCKIFGISLNPKKYFFGWWRGNY